MTNLNEFLKKATATIDRGEPFDVVYLDLAKAFDTVPLERLPKKLPGNCSTGLGRPPEMGKKLGVTQKAASGPEREIFNMGESAVGGPWGSVLGPLLFVIFTSDINETVVQWRLSRNLLTTPR